MHIIPIQTRLFQIHENLEQFIFEHIPTLEEGDIVVVTSKIVSLAEGNVISENELEGALRKKADHIVKTPWTLLTQIKNEWSVNGGADRSNSASGVIMLPRDPFHTARTLAKSLRKKYKIKNLGVIITDTRSTPLRVGTLGRTIGYAGIKPLKNYIGKKDLFGRKSRVTISNHIDALAVSAVLNMGEGNEQIPLAVIEKAPVEFSQTIKNIELNIPAHKDLFSYIYKLKVQKPQK